MCRWCLSRIQLDVNLAWDDHLARLPDDIRPLVMSEWIEEMIVEAIGASEAWPFIRDCFNATGMPYFLTHRDSEEHLRLWQTKDK